MTMHITGDPGADAELDANPFSLLVGMLLDQQVTMEWAFGAPTTLAQRLGGELTPAVVVDHDPEAFVALASQTPAIHRFPQSMARRVQALAAYLVAEYDGDTEALWRDVPTGQELLRRLRALPGFGEQKARIFIALLGKQREVQPPGWREAAGDYGDDGVHRSVADVVDAESLAQVRAYKQEVKRQAKERASS